MGLANITEQLAPGGFLLAYEATKPLPVFAWGLDKVTWNFTDEREYGLWMSPQRWHAQLAAAGLVMVSEHTCVSKYATMNRCMHMGNGTHSIPFSSCAVQSLIHLASVLNSSLVSTFSRRYEDGFLKDAVIPVPWLVYQAGSRHVMCESSLAAQ